MADTPPLSWGLLIATKDRLAVLKTSVELALKQTWPPAEVIVVDASADWEANAAAIDEIVRPHPEVRFDYREADVPSLTVQRNQAIDLAQADILFMIDDDSFMYPDCAAEILRVYEADVDGEVAGVQATAAPMPDSVAVKAPRKRKGRSRFRNRIGNWLTRKVFVMGAVEGFIPYDGAYPQRPVPASLAGLDVHPVRLLGGSRMTYRRDVIARVRFDSLLRYYSPFEDNDASYRVSREGCLLTASRARLHHYTAASGRIDRLQVAHLAALNQAMLIRRHSPALEGPRRAYFRLLRRRIVAEFLKDLLSGRFSFPQIRGILRARAVAPRIFEMPEAELEAWYPEMQRRIVKG